uniref:Uncharacterized protein n=1 Tax=Homalodisca liturata TaxID=320908 RepID=A0A1B6JJB7_9HEMI
MRLLPSALFFLCFTSCSVINVNTESLGISKSNLEEETGPKLLQHLQNVRHRRDAPSDACTGKCGCQGPTKGSHVNKAHPPRNVIAYHYHHHYYYCCPSMVHHANKNPHWAQAARHTQATARKDPTSSVDCGCNATGACSCTVQEKSNVQDCRQNNKQEPLQNAAFGFGMALDTPIGRDFFEFISKNFVKKDSPGQPNTCQGNIAHNNLEDPVCREFFNFFSQNFMRKGEQSTVTPTQPPTPVPTQACQSGHFQGSMHEFNDMKTMFDTLKNEMEDTISKTADIAKKMGMPIL